MEQLRSKPCGVLIALVALCWSAPAGALSMSISEASSDGTPAAALAATFDFMVSGTTLTLVVTNDTDSTGLGDYRINGIFFNAAGNVSGLTLTSPSDWGLRTNAKGGGTFGRFDFAVLGGEGQSPSQIDAGTSLTFEFDISGTGPFAATDFTCELSTNPPGDTPSSLAAKFVQGPGDDSAFGATTKTLLPGPAVPEPGAGALLAGALLAAGWRLRAARR